MPSGMPIARVPTTAATISVAVTGNPEFRIFVVGSPVKSEVPKLPCTAALSQCQYCTYHGKVQPEAFLKSIDCGRRCRSPQDCPCCVAGCDRCEHEGQCGHREQEWNRHEEPAEQDPKHDRPYQDPSSALFGVRLGTPPSSGYISRANGSGLVRKMSATQRHLAGSWLKSTHIRR